VQAPSDDIYALGALLYLLLCGQAPVTVMQRSQGAMLQAPHAVNPRVSRAVSEAVMWAMEMRVEQRAPSLDAFLKRLSRCEPTVSSVKTDLFQPHFENIVAPRQSSNITPAKRLFGKTPGAGASAGGSGIIAASSDAQPDSVRCNAAERDMASGDASSSTGAPPDNSRNLGGDADRFTGLELAAGSRVTAFYISPVLAAGTTLDKPQNSKYPVAACCGDTARSQNVSGLARNGIGEH
jgi:hypothetical protein